MTQKVISEAGSQQLLLDTYNLKTLLLHLHSLGSSGSEQKIAPPAVYSKFVLQKASQIETTLKLVGTPKELLLERFRIMWADGRQEDLVAVMTLKGMKRPDMQALVDAYATSAASTAAALPASSSAGAGSSGDNSAPAPAGASSYFTLDSSNAAVGVASSVRTLTQDMTTSAITSLSAVGNLKWGK